MAAPSPHRLFAVWRVEAPFSSVSLLRWALQSAFSWTRCLTVHDATSCAREDSLDECGRRRASPLLPCGFSGAELYWCMRFSHAKDIYRLDLLQDVANEGHHILKSGAHIP